ncbi:MULTISPECIES: ArnT family glycosyltransferase [Fusobacterium]|uniref:ArnT family glycosyltransferase n=1 Tax=Fusobacterium TaxID=848 RepID=UPI000686498D|nr:glycosyltransferase family 39 protein [Fusobacterium sp. CM1]
MLELFKIKLKNNHYLYLFLIYLLIAVPIAYLRFPDIRNEIKYFIISKNILIKENYFVLRYFSEFYPDKPPLYFWILSFCQKIFPNNFFFVSVLLTSIVPSFILIIFFYKFLKNFKSKDGAFLMTLSLLTIPFFFGVSIFARMDILMSLFIFLALYYFFGFYYKFIKISNINLFLFYLFIFLALFTKGLAGFFLPTLILFVFLIVEKKLNFLKKIRFIKGNIFIICLIGLWFLVIIFEPQGKEYINAIIFKEAIGRVMKSKVHIRPFYYYIEQIPLIIFPYGILLLISLIHYIKNMFFTFTWTKLEKISFVWVVSSLIIFSLASGKLSIYLLPIFPAMVILIYEAILNNKNKKYIEYGLKSVEIFSILAPILNKKFNSEKKLYNRFLNINISLLIIFFSLIFFIKIYNDNYTLKKFLPYLKQSSEKIVAYDFSDAKNLEFYIDKHIDNLTNISYDNNNIIILTRKNDIANFENKNYILIDKNKEYFLYKKIK